MSGDAISATWFFSFSSLLRLKPFIAIMCRCKENGGWNENVGRGCECPLGMRTAERNENVGRVRGWRARINGESRAEAGVEGLSRGRESKD